MVVEASTDDGRPGEPTHRWSPCGSSTGTAETPSTSQLTEGLDSPPAPLQEKLNHCTLLQVLGSSISCYSGRTRWCCSRRRKACGTRRRTRGGSPEGDKLFEQDRCASLRDVHDDDAHVVRGVARPLLGPGEEVSEPVAVGYSMVLIGGVDPGDTVNPGGADFHLAACRVLPGRDEVL